MLSLISILNLGEAFHFLFIGPVLLLVICYFAMNLVPIILLLLHSKHFTFILKIKTDF